MSDNETRPNVARGEPIIVELKVSFGLAQFLTEVEMQEHPGFDPVNRNHLELLEEWNNVKESVRGDIEEVAPLVLLNDLLVTAKEAFEDDDQNGESRGPQAA